MYYLAVMGLASYFSWIPRRDTYRTPAGFGHHTILATISCNALFDKAESDFCLCRGGSHPCNKEESLAQPIHVTGGETPSLAPTLRIDRQTGILAPRPCPRIKKTKFRIASW
jgi:hypothetical protein